MPLIDTLLALEMIGSDTGMTIGLGLTLAMLVTGIVVSRERHGAAIKTHSDKIKVLEVQVGELRDWQIARQAADDAIKESSASTARGTKPYPR